MPPPYLPGDAPVLDIVHPLKIRLGPRIWYDSGGTCLDCNNRLFCQGFDLNKPLPGKIRLYSCFTPIAVSNTVLVGLHLLQKAFLTEGLNDFLSTFKPIFSLETTCLFIHTAVFVNHLDRFKVMSQTDFKVMGIVGRRNLQCTGPKSHIHIFVKDDGNSSVHQG